MNCINHRRNYKMDTILNNLKLAWRSFLRDKLYSWVKISSLTIGGAACRVSWQSYIYREGRQ